MDAIQNDGTSETAIHASRFLVDSSYTTQRNSAFGELGLEIKIGLVGKFVQTCAHRHSMPNLYKTARFGHIWHIATNEVSLFDCKASSKLEDFVSFVPLILPLTVALLEFASRAGRLTEGPHFVVKKGFARRKNYTPIFVVIDDSCQENTPFFGFQTHILGDFVRDFTHGNRTEYLFRTLHCDSKAVRGFHKAYDK